MQPQRSNGAPPPAASRLPDGARLAAAPISWGVCEVPGWGLMLPPERVLREMAELSVGATERRPIGWLPVDRDAVRTALDAHGLRLVGGFVPVVLHEPSFDAAAASETARVLAAAGADVFVAAAVTDLAWAPRIALADTQWTRLVAHLAELERVVSGHGLTLALHPHAGTLVETAGTRSTSAEATKAGLFRPLGQGDAAIADVVDLLHRSGYRRWLVVEQDTAITGQEPPVGSGPVLDVQASIEFLQTAAPGRERERLP
jgi:inosose dehydratase